MDRLKYTSSVAAVLGTLAAATALIGLPTMLLQISDLEATLDRHMADYMALAGQTDAVLKHIETPDVQRYKRQVRADGREGMCPGGEMPLTTRFGALIECATTLCVPGFRCMPDATCCPILDPSELPVEPLLPTLVDSQQRLRRPLQQKERKAQPQVRSLYGGQPTTTTTTTTTTARPAPVFGGSSDAAGGNCGCLDEPRDCPAGPPGEPGAAGEDGENGEDGQNGLPGADVEPQPDSCARDNVCEPCPPGEPGRAGPKGSPGGAGRPGRAGAKGKNGKNGDNGKAGAPGSAGKGGSKGGKGKPGPKGKDGTKAATGEPGRKGPTGPKGEKGQPGRPGKSISGTGPTGDKGGTGPVGPAGPSGPAGSAGGPGGNGRPGNDAEYCPCPPRRNGGSNNQQQFNQRRQNFSFRRGFNNKA